MDYEINWKLRCNSCSEVREKISNYSSSFLFFLILTIIIVGLIIMTIVLMGEGEINLSRSETEKALGILFLVTEPILLILMIVGFVWGYVLKKELEVEWVAEKKRNTESIDRMIDQ